MAELVGLREAHARWGGDQVAGCDAAAGSRPVASGDLDGGAGLDEAGAGTAEASLSTGSCRLPQEQSTSHSNVYWWCKYGLWKELSRASI